MHKLSISWILQYIQLSRRCLWLTLHAITRWSLSSPFRSLWHYFDNWSGDAWTETYSQFVWKPYSVGRYLRILGSNHDVVLVWWLMKYTSPSRVVACSHPSGRGPSEFPSTDLVPKNKQTPNHICTYQFSKISQTFCVQNK